ncbi:MAG: YdcF family protein [Bacteroidales bacterium]|jgi:uncharacterized SAM-binding protein YcdF (DUF218 family)|nr:YdcF family protein [Bacteroidales bacterium]
MFFILSKTIGLLAKPLTWLVVLMLIAVSWRKPKLKRFSLIASLVILLVFTNPFAINIALKLWEPAPVAIETLPVYDIGIVLGGFARYLPGSDNIELTDAGDRLWQAVSLYRQGKTGKILISGGGAENTKSEAAAVRDALIAMGIPDSAILTETRSRNTHENAVFSAELVTANQPGATCVLITSALHMKRSLGCFRKAGLNPDAFPAEHIARYDKVYWADWLRPEPSALKYWERVMNEWIGIIVYKLQGYI